MAEQSPKLEITFTGFSFELDTEIMFAFWGCHGMVLIGPFNLRTMNYSKTNHIFFLLICNNVTMRGV
jgi:hypothetical protein